MYNQAISYIIIKNFVERMVGYTVRKKLGAYDVSSHSPRLGALLVAAFEYYSSEYVRRVRKIVDSLK